MSINIGTSTIPCHIQTQTNVGAKAKKIYWLFFFTSAFFPECLTVFVFHFNHRLNTLPWTAKSNACKTAAFWQAIKMKRTADDILIHFDVTVCGSAEWDLKTQRGEGHLFMRHGVLHSLLLKTKDCELHFSCYTLTLSHLHDWKELLIWNNKHKKKRHLQQR